MRNRVAGLAVLAILSTVSVSAQEPPAASLAHIVKNVVLDPTTYAPGMILYGAMRLDWESSQIFFRHGFVEHNTDYTVSGVADTAAIGRRTGNRRIAGDAARVLQLSLAHNVAARILEHELTRRYPTHRKLFRVVGRIERIAAASFLSTALSAAHVRQWRRNVRLARELGYR